MSQGQETCDAVIVGGGPAGATAAIILACAGLRVILLEKVCFPRFHIGESFLPPWAMRWRMALFNLCVRLNRWAPLVPRQARFSLVNSQITDPVHAGVAE